MFGLADMVDEDDTDRLDDLTQVEYAGVDGGNNLCSTRRTWWSTSEKTETGKKCFCLKLACNNQM